MRSFDTPLPIDAVLSDLAARLQERPNAVLVAPPGAGKTTRVPPAMLAARQVLNFPRPPFHGFNLADYYRRNVIGGPNAFLVEARDIRSFGEALRHKLIVEIAGARPPPSRSAADRG